MESSKDFLGETETIIIGGGQAGLSVARYLKEKGRQFLILEKSSSIGTSWAERYDSLVLDSFAKYGQLEGFPFPGNQNRQPAKDEVVEYLKSFAGKFNLQPQFSTEVLKITKEGEDFVVETDKGKYTSRYVVLATGPFHKSFIPKESKEISPEIFQIHSKDYKNPRMIPEGPVLVVGGGNSGAEIAQELASNGRKVYFSFKGSFKSVKNTTFSQWMAYELGLAHVPKHSLLGKFVIWYTKSKAIGAKVKPFLKTGEMVPVGAFVGAQGDQGHQGEEIICSKQKLKDIQAVIWATGYETDFSLISIPKFNAKSERRGVTNILGLFLLHIRWQYSKSSSHLAGVSRDAKYIAAIIIKQR